MAAARAMLDEDYGEPQQQERCDQNNYCLGRIGKHNVVIACLPAGVYGITSVTTVATQMMSSFKSIRFGLMVGIGGGAPSKERDIRLGDVVVSKPEGTLGGVVQFDFGKQVGDGQFKRIGSLNKPPQVLLTAVSRLDSEHRMRGSSISKFLSEAMMKIPKTQQAFSYQGPQNDQLFEAEYDHVGDTTCEQCDVGRLVKRPTRGYQDPDIHYGTIASSSQVMKRGITRERLRENLGVLCFEMEAAGLMDNFPCLVVRGICDYADSHKNKGWQGYAALTAAAYAKELLHVVPGDELSTRATTEIIGQKLPSIPVQLPHPRNRHFKGRVKILDEVCTTFGFNNDPPSCPLGRKEIILHGLGGAGKSQIALEYTYRCGEKYSAVFWINAGNATDLEISANIALQSIVNHYAKTWDLASCYPRIALSLNIFKPQIRDHEGLMDAVNELSSIKLLKDWLPRDSNNGWLLIIDNYDGPDSCDLKQILPNTDMGHVLITSRNRNAHPTADQILVPESIGKEESEARDIVKLVGELPLAIDLAGAYLREDPIPIKKYARWLKNRPGRIFDPIATVWKLSFDKLGENAQRLLQLCSLIGNEDIPFELLEGGKHSINWMTDDSIIREAVKGLRSFSFVHWRPDDSLWIHPPVHQWVRNSLSNDAKYQNSQLVAKMVTSTFVFDDAKTSDQWVYERRILSHINSVFEIFKSQLAPEEGSLDDWARGVAGNLARIYAHLGDVKKSDFLYKRCLRGVEASRRIQDPEMMGSFGKCLSLQGKYGEALEWYTQALDAMQSLLGPDDHLTLETQQNRALVLRDLGKHDEALSLLRQVQDTRERNPSLGADHPSTLRTIHIIATVFEKQSKYEEALESHKAVLEGQKRHFGENNHSTLDTMDSIASVYERQGLYLRALEWYERVLKGLEELFGKETVHPWTLSTLSGKADILVRQGRYDEAEEIYRKVHAGFKTLDIRVLGEFPTATNLGRVLRDKGQYKEALKWCTEAREGLEKELEQAGDHPYTLASKFCIASIFELQGNFEEAIGLYQQVFEVDKATSGMNHSDTLKTMCSIASVFTQQGLYDQALQYYGQAEEGLEKVVGLDHPSTLMAVQGRADILERLGHYDEAFEQYRRVEEGLKQRLSKEHPQIFMAVYGMARVSESKGKHGEALKLFQQAINGWKMTFGEDHPSILMGLHDMGTVLRAEGRYDEATPLFQKALDGCRRKLGNTHPWTSRAVRSLSDVLAEKSQCGSAKKLHSEALSGLGTTLGTEHPPTITAKQNIRGYSNKRKADADGPVHKRRRKATRNKEKEKPKLKAWVYLRFIY
ncbi:MAG: hypothetical protein M1839_002032 [Geoglossum umbratile]|nr:MAG: hypothetical protein M1839_002032 [Geoglossum umbratile]